MVSTFGPSKRLSARKGCVQLGGMAADDTTTGRSPARPEDRTQDRTQGHIQGQVQTEMAGEGAGRGGGEHRIRSRLVWAGVAGAVVGMVLIALGMVLGVAWLAWLGVAVLVIGAVVAWRSGILYDVHSSGSLAHEKAALAAGGTVPGHAPGDLEHDEAARRHAEVVSEESRVLLARSTQAPMPPLAPAASLMLLVLGVWTYVAHFVLHYSMSIRGQNTALRDTGLAAVIILTALFLRHVGPSRVASALALLWGGLLVLAGVLAPHASAQSAVNEIVTGCLVAVCAVGTWRG
jgi:hypothetical protein